MGLIGQVGGIGVFLVAEESELNNAVPPVGQGEELVTTPGLGVEEA